MSSFGEILTTHGEVRSVLGRFLNERGDVEKLKQLSRRFRENLGELRYPIGDPRTAIVGTITYLDTHASSSATS